MGAAKRGGLPSLSPENGGDRSFSIRERGKDLSYFILSG